MEETTRESVRNATELHHVLGGEPNYTKVLDHLETHSLRWAAESPLVAVAIATLERPSICLVDTRGRVRADARDVSIRVDDGDIVDWSAKQPQPVGSLWLLPALEETMRLNGWISRTADGIRIRVTEMYMHCAKAFKRSQLWADQRLVVPDSSTQGTVSEGEFVAASPFALLATVDSEGNADLSPRGDPSGEFCRLSDDGSVLVIPDRPGNKIADSMHNLLSNPNASAMFLVPGCSRVLEVQGKIKISTKLSNREATAVKGRVPKVVLELNIDSVRFDDSADLVTSKVWDKSTYVSRADWPSFGKIVADQVYGDKPAAPVVASFEEQTRDDYENNMY
jgi:predicted pyridoxine 5'-phosphate oxidase superfamily flavin-nucleotide-binding protein